MAVAGGGSRRKTVSEINVVPYIDVMLVLLVIFMITAPLMLEGVKVDLPETEAGQIKKDDAQLIVSVDAEGQVYLERDGSSVAMSREKVEDYARVLFRRQPYLQVLVRGDTNTIYGNVVKVMAALQRAGAKGVGLIVEREES